MRFSGKDISVAINVRDEPCVQVDECLSRVHANLPGSAVKIIINGTQRPEIKRLADHYGFVCENSVNAKPNLLLYVWFGRMFSFFNKQGRIYNLKIDPDTMIDRSPSSMPNDDYFGSIDQNANQRFVQGGMQGMSLRAIQSIIESKKFLSPTTQLYPDWIKPEENTEDWALGYIMQELGFDPQAWDECRSQWRVPVIQPSHVPLRYAICHPRYYGFGKYGFKGLPPSKEYCNVPR